MSFNIDAHDFVSELSKNLVDQHIQWGLHAIGAPFAWRFTKGEGIKVAVLDTGIEDDHPDLSDNVVVTANFTGSRHDYYDVQGHGTHVAGIIGGTDNDQGIIGVAPKVSLYSAKVLGDNGSGSLQAIIDGMDWAIEQNVDIINLSLGTSVKPPQIFHDAIKRAFDQGIVIVGATGNDNGEVCYPARYPEVLAVSAVGKRLKRADFSNFGIENELIAPGVDVTSTHINHKYAKLSGTSMATPMVAGALALYLARLKQVGIKTTSLPTLRDALEASLFTIDGDEHTDEYGKGMLDLRTLMLMAASDEEEQEES